MNVISARPARPPSIFMFPWIIIWALLSATILTLWRHENWDVFWSNALGTFVGIFIVRLTISLYQRWKSKPE